MSDARTKIDNVLSVFWLSTLAIGNLAYSLYPQELVPSPSFIQINLLSVIAMIGVLAIFVVSHARSLMGVATKEDFTKLGSFHTTTFFLLTFVSPNPAFWIIINFLILIILVAESFVPNGLYLLRKSFLL